MTARFALTLALAVVWSAPLAGDDDKPGRGVARISVINGDVSVRRGDTGDWTAAAINAPLVVQDRLFTGAGSRAEVQFDYANMVRLAANSEIRLGELEYRRYTIQISRGLVTFRVLRDSDSDVEISTPSVAVRPVKKGIYRVTVREDGATEIAVRSGEAEIYTPRGVERLRSGRTMLARGTASDPEFQLVSNLAEDDWDRWNERRDRDLERSRSYRYVSRDIYGAEDLDSHGRWVYVPPYGWVWAPHVSAGWAPYRYGRWSWVDWYGWSWISYDPWGWAPYHYGRWFHHGPYGWCWWPGGYYSRHYWRPALVAFFGWSSYSGFHVGVGFGRIGWIPLAPYEAYRPWYGYGHYRGYRNTTYIDNSVNIVNNVNITNIYRNARVNNAITAVDGADFSRGRVGSIRGISDSEIRRASLVQGVVPVVPDRESLRLSDRQVEARAAEASGSEGRFYSRRQAAPVERVSFDEQRRGLERISRRAFGEEPVRAGRSAEQPSRAEAARAADPPGRTSSGVETRRATEPEGRGWRRADEPVRSAQAPGAEVRSDQGGWRRFGQPDTRSAEEAGSRRSASEPEDRGGWRRFGEPDTRSAEEAGSRRSASEPGDRGGWRRFGEPARDSSGMIDRSESGSRRSAESEDREGWRGIGTRRQSGDSDSGVFSPRRSERYEAPRSESPRFERRGNDSPRRQEAPRYESPRMESPRYERRGGEDPVRISPPIIRERSPRSDDGGSGRSGGGRVFEGSPRGGGDFGGRRGGDSGPSSGGMRGGDPGGGRSAGGEGIGRSSGGEGRGGGGRIR